MATKKEENKYSNVMDVFLSGWARNIGMLEETEKKSLQMIESQKEWIDIAREQLSQLEDNAKKMTTDWKTNMQEIVMNISKEKGGIEWAEKLEEIGHKTQTLVFSPGKASLDILSNSHKQFEITYKNSIEQQQKNRTEVTKAMEGFLEQLKNAQMNYTKFFELPAKF